MTQETTGGNPDAYRTIQTILGPTTDYGQVTSFHRLAGATWDPSTGPFASLDYSEDSILIEPPGAAQGMATGPALRQNDPMYIRPGLFTPEPTWTHRAAFGVTADQFILIQGCCNAHPDFSASGSTIEFGFFRANSAAPGG